MKKALNIVIADDQIYALAGFKVLLDLKEQINIVGTANSPERAVQIVIENKPDVIIFDLLYGSRGGFEDALKAIQQIKTVSPNTRILAMTAYDHLLERVIQAGVDKAVHKDNLFSLEEIIACIEDAYRARTMPKPVLPYKPLSPREQEVLALMCTGASDQQIADSLNIAISTVKSHDRNIFSKLGVANRKEAISHALKNDMVNQNHHP
jgi:NarL family two-component system response regulator LiaR